MRLLGVVRLSRSDPSSTSVERQREDIERFAALSGHDIVAWAIDDGVSGDVAPWARPALGDFLPKALAHRDAKPQEMAMSVHASRADEWEGMVLWKLDRLARRAADLLAVIDWCRAERRQVFEANGTEYTGPAGTMIVSVLGGLAQGERERMVERARSSFDKLARDGRWRGGTPPWGYRVTTGEDGHKYLVLDVEQATLIRSTVARVLAGESVNGICGEYNQTGVPTPSGRGVWRMGSLLRALKSERLLGYMVREEKRPGEPTREYVVRGEDGLPVRRADPIISRADLDALRARLAEDRNPGSGRRPGVRPDRALLLRVLLCGECYTSTGEHVPMYRAKGRNAMLYRCSTRSVQGRPACSNVSVPATEVEAVVTDIALGFWGRSPIMTRVWEQGNDAAEMLAEVNENLRMMRGDRAAGLYKGPKGEAEFREMYATLEKRREHLDSLPQRPSGWRLEESGETLAQRWGRAESDSERNTILREMGVGTFVYRGTGRRGQRVGDRLDMVMRLGMTERDLEGKSEQEMLDMIVAAEAEVAERVSRMS